MGHRRIKKPKVSKAEAELLARSILYPGTKLPEKFQAVAARLERVVQKGIERTDAQWDLLHTCLDVLDHFLLRASDYSGQSSEMIVTTVKGMNHLRDQVADAIALADDFFNTNYHPKIIYDYHDKVHRAMEETLSACDKFLQFLTLNTPGLSNDHPIWELKRQLSEALAGESRTKATLGKEIDKILDEL